VTPIRAPTGDFVEETVNRANREGINLWNLNKGIDHPGQNKARHDANPEIQRALGKNRCRDHDRSHTDKGPHEGLQHLDDFGYEQSHGATG
jgi:hypothetical protein